MGLEVQTVGTFIGTGAGTVRLELPSIIGLVLEIRRVSIMFGGGIAGSPGRVFALTHDLSHPVVDVDFFSRRYWWLSEHDYGDGEGGQNDHQVFDPPLDVAGPQLWVISSGGNELAFPALTVYYTTRKISQVPWTDLASKTSHERG